jgi:hypothetical protein
LRVDFLDGRLLGAESSSANAALGARASRVVLVDGAARFAARRFTFVLGFAGRPVPDRSAAYRYSSALVAMTGF